MNHASWQYLNQFATKEDNMEKYTVTFAIIRNDDTRVKDTYEYTSKERAREAYERLAMNLIEKSKTGIIKDFEISRSRNTGR